MTSKEREERKTKDESKDALEEFAKWYKNEL